MRAIRRHYYTGSTLQFIPAVSEAPGSSRQLGSLGRKLKLADKAQPTLFVSIADNFSRLIIFQGMATSCRGSFM